MIAAMISRSWTALLCPIFFGLFFSAFMTNLVGWTIGQLSGAFGTPLRTLPDRWIDQLSAGGWLSLYIATLIGAWASLPSRRLKDGRIAAWVIMALIAGFWAAIFCFERSSPWILPLIFIPLGIAFGYQRGAQR